VHTGPVVVGEMGAGARRETLVLGETTNVAARLEAAAAPDSVVTSETTLRLARGMFVTENLGALTLKGVPEPLPAHRVVQPSGVRSRFEVAAGDARALLAPLYAWFTEGFDNARPDRREGAAGGAVIGGLHRPFVRWPDPPGSDLCSSIR
jgi:hypothetical protein